MRQHWPDVAAHEGVCRTRLFIWRVRHPGQAADHDAFPCTCAKPGPWLLHEVDHPAWCVLGDTPHPWHDCTITAMVPTEGP